MKKWGELCFIVNGNPINNNKNNNGKKSENKTWTSVQCLIIYYKLNDVQENDAQ